MYSGSRFYFSPQDFVTETIIAIFDYIFFHSTLHNSTISLLSRSLHPCAPPVTIIFLRYSFNNKLTEWLLLKMASFQENCFVILVIFWLLFKTYDLLVIGLFRSQELRALFASDLSRTIYLIFCVMFVLVSHTFCFILFHKRWEKLWGWCLV